MPSWRLAAITLAAMAALLTAGAAQEPTFRSRVDLVTVDAAVTGEDGAPIENLAPTDFQIKVDGRVRPVVSAQFLLQNASAAAAERLGAAHFTSNEFIDSGRRVVVAVDQAHISRLEGRQALAAATAFIGRLDPIDYVSVVSLAQAGALTFTRDRVALASRLATLVGQSDPLLQTLNLGLSEALEIADGSRARLADAVLRECGRALTEYVSLNRAAEDAGAGRDACPEQVEQESRALAQHAHVQARQSLGAIEALLAMLQPLPGPKTLVLLSEGLVADPRRVDLLKLASAAQAARVAIYVLQLEAPVFDAGQARVSPSLTRDLQVRADGLSRLAGATRGAVFRLVGSDERPFARIARETSAYYLLAFEAADVDRDGRAHRITVEVRRRGVDVRSRTAFTLPATVPSPRSRADTLVTLLRSNALATELPLRAATYTYLEPDSDKLRVVVSAETDVAPGAASVLMGFVVVDRAGVIVATASRETSGGRHAFSALVAPGAYTLRVAAIDPLGRHGSVERAFVARASISAGVRVGDLVLSPTRARASDAIEPFVDAVSGSSMEAYVEIHAAAGQALPQIAAAFEVVAESGGPPLVRVPATIVRQGTWAALRGVVPLVSLAAGRYSARVVFVAPEGSGSVTRSFTLRAPAQSARGQ